MFFFFLIDVVMLFFFFFFQAEDGIRDIGVTGVQTCALPITPLTAPWRTTTGRPRRSSKQGVPRMARAKRMGAYNALDDLLPGPPRPRLEPVPDPPLSRRRSRGGPNALDELLPGPRGVAGADDVVPGRPVPRGRSVGGRHLGIWNPLDGPPASPQPAPVAVPVK